MRRVLTVKDLTEVLPIKRNKAYALMKSKGFPSVRIGRKYVVLEDDLEEYLKSNIGNQILFNN